MDLGFAVTSEADNEWGDDVDNEPKVESVETHSSKGPVVKQESAPTTLGNINVTG